MSESSRDLLRIYADTSVFGGCFEPEFSAASLRFFRLVRERRISLLLTRVVRDELREAPMRVQAVLQALPPDVLEDLEVTEAVLALRGAYLAAGVVRPLSTEDATHVAAATVAGAAAIVSWNFRHMVRLDRIQGYNRINLQLGYGCLTIISPRSVHVP